MSNTRKSGEAAGDATHAAHSEAEPAAEAGMSRDFFNIPDNVIQDGINDYHVPDQDDLMWMVGYTRKELDSSRSRLCELLDADWTTITRILNGTYTASIKGFMAKVSDLRSRYNRTVQTGFIETYKTRKIFDTLDYALNGDLNGGRIVMITGRARTGKTEAVQEWCRRNNHGKSVYIDCPASGGLRAFQTEIANETGINKQRKTLDMGARLFKSFNRRRILILDEVARIIPGRWGTKPTELEWVRRLHDLRRCAVALICTEVAEQEMESGALHLYFEQLIGRIAEPLHLPKDIMKREVRDIVTAFNPRPSEELVTKAHEIANEKGRLGVLFEDLRKATAFAREKKTALTAAHLSVVHSRRSERHQWKDE